MKKHSFFCCLVPKAQHLKQYEHFEPLWPSSLMFVQAFSLFEQYWGVPAPRQRASRPLQSRLCTRRTLAGNFLEEVDATASCWQDDLYGPLSQWMLDATSLAALALVMAHTGSATPAAPLALAPPSAH